MKSYKILSTPGAVLLLILSMWVTGGLKAQEPCPINIDTPMPVCRGAYFELSVFDEPYCRFEWYQRQGSDSLLVGEESFLGIALQDTATFRALIIDTINPDTCYADWFHVDVYPAIEVEFVQYQLTCTNGDNDNGNNAKVGATAYGEYDPDQYHYFWDVLPLQIAPGDSTLAIGLKAHQNYAIMVRDDHGCMVRDTFYTQAYSNPLVEIYTDPSDTVFLQNPFVTYSFENLSADSVTISNYFWEIIEGDTIFDSDLPAPTYAYHSVGEFYTYLTVFNPQGCDTVFTHVVEVKPVELFIPNVFTPGDGTANETFIITDVDKKFRDDALARFYERSRLVVFNRLGRKVFEAENYNNTWNGDNLPDGVYYYVLECYGARSTDVFKGSVTIIRTN